MKINLNDKTGKAIRALIADGFSVEQITEQLGIAKCTVYLYIRGYNLSGRDSHDDIVNLRKAGHSIPEICELTGKDRKTISSKCRDIGLPETDEEKEELREWFSKRFRHSEEWARQYIHEKTDGRLEYKSGYVNMDSHIIATCTHCGAEQERSMVSFRLGKHPVCIFCKFGLQKRNKGQTEKARLKEAEKQKRQIEKETAKLVRAGRGKQLSFGFCACGEMLQSFDGHKGRTCPVCRKRAENQRKEIKRRKKVSRVIVDKNITLEALYRRDKGICHICGGQCDLEDKEDRGNVIVCGNMYPSIDHIKPLAKGGLHSWDNVKLAHRICNSLKGDSYDEVSMEKTNSESDEADRHLSRAI